MIQIVDSRLTLEESEESLGPFPSVLCTLVYVLFLFLPSSTLSRHPLRALTIWKKGDARKSSTVV